MKKLKVVIYLIGISLIAVSCSSKTTSSDSDELKNEQLEATQDVSKSDTENLTVTPEEALTLSVANKDLDYADESSSLTGSVTVEITNNGTVAVKGSDYNVAYVEIIEEWVGTQEDGGLDDVEYNRTIPGKDIAPNETIQIALKSNDRCQGIKSPKIVNVTK